MCAELALMYKHWSLEQELLRHATDLPSHFLQLDSHKSVLSASINKFASTGKPWYHLSSSEVASSYAGVTTFFLLAHMVDNNISNIPAFHRLLSPSRKHFFCSTALPPYWSFCCFHVFKPNFMRFVKVVISQRIKGSSFHKIFCHVIVHGYRVNLRQKINSFSPN